ncbi:MAG: anaerobic ribonucleoside-triphosphate reductase activating protein [Prevotellaceae bacterium]|jgi:anaerobic ribonucleoside-triphosphate reductase activating protein|nr:anaerobic ribonucleoside-triphosphate reductase activating protein [Prevotellaceae bacterium]
MLQFASYSIVFQEVPGEVTLAINLSGCPNRCKGCHSPHLQENTGRLLDSSALAELLEKYGSAITCVCFMGGDAAPDEVEQLAKFLRQKTGGRIKAAWYSGKPELPAGCSAESFSYIKLGSYIERLGGLDSAATNQRFYRIDNRQMADITKCFHKKCLPTNAT